MEPDPRPPHYPLLQSPPPGAHLILWSDGSPFSDRAITTFLAGALDREDLCVVIQPEEGLVDSRDALRAQGVDLDKLEADTRALVVTPELLGLYEPEDVSRVPGILSDLRSLARDCGRSGVSILIRLAPPLFEGRQEAFAEAVEESVRDFAGDVRMLCVYRRSLTQNRAGQAIALTRCHTHAITALGGERFFVELLRPFQGREAYGDHLYRRPRRELRGPPGGRLNGRDTSSHLARDIRGG